MRSRFKVKFVTEKLYYDDETGRPKRLKLFGAYEDTAERCTMVEGPMPWREACAAVRRLNAEDKAR